MRVRGGSGYTSWFLSMALAPMVLLSNEMCLEMSQNIVFLTSAEEDDVCYFSPKGEWEEVTSFQPSLV